MVEQADETETPGVSSHASEPGQAATRLDERDIAVLEAVADRVLWLSTRMIHEANLVRPNADGLKVGGHQAFSASAVSIFTALYGTWLRRHDLFSPKPHASPAYRALSTSSG